MSSVYSTRIRQVILDNLSQFESTSNGSNIGIGFTGWDSAFDYSFGEDLRHFGAIFPLSGDPEEPMAFGNGMWRWSYLIKMYTRYDGKEDEDCDTLAATLSDDFVNMMFEPAVRQYIDSTGWVKVVGANHLSDVLKVNDVVYISMEFLIAIKEQIEI